MKKINRVIWGKLSLQKERGSVRLIQVDKEESRERGRDGRMEEAGHVEHCGPRQGVTEPPGVSQTLTGGHGGWVRRGQEGNHSKDGRLLH